MENMNLKSMNVHALDSQDACQISGGMKIPSIIRNLTPAAFALWVIDNWEDVKKGISDGWYVR